MADKRVRGSAGTLASVRRLTLVLAAAASIAGTGWVGAARADTVQLRLSYQSFSFFDGASGGCDAAEPIYVSEPAAPGSYPVVIYLHGTGDNYGGDQDGQDVAQMAADQGWLGAAVTWVDVNATQQGVDGQANCMFDVASPGDALAQICSLPQADCSHGVVLSGMSTGGAIAARAKNFNSAVDAVWAMGVSGPVAPAALAAPAGTRALPNDRLRIDDGQTDLQVTNPSTGQVSFDFSGVNALTGQGCQTFNCLNPDGSGYYVVQNSEVADGVADHCFWMDVNLADPANSCTLTPTFDPGFIPPSTTQWSITNSLAWLRAELAASPVVSPETVGVTPLPPITGPAPPSHVKPKPKHKRKARRHRRHVTFDRWLGRVKQKHKLPFA
jgi:dienelactone hydrolase